MKFQVPHANMKLYFIKNTFSPRVLHRSQISIDFLNPPFRSSIVEFECKPAAFSGVLSIRFICFIMRTLASLHASRAPFVH